MKQDLAAIGADIKSGKGPQLLLLLGDDLQVQDSCKALIELLVPQSHRAFNLERFDGRAAGWDAIEASLMTPPFFSGKKVIWIENITCFISREQKGELREKVLSLWSENKQDEAARLLADLLSVQGWAQDRWVKVQSGSSGALAEFLGVDGPEARHDLEALVVYCQSKGIELSRRPGTGDFGLADLLDRGLPEWGFLLLTAVQVDRRTRLYKRLDEMRAVLYVGLERDKNGRLSRESLTEFIHQRMRRAAKHLEPQAREMILTRAGEDLRALQQELDKLALFVGDKPSISASDVETILMDHGEGWIFNLTRSLADRDAVAALAQLARLMSQGEHPLKLLATLAGETRRLLSARQLIETELRGRWKSGMSFQQFQQKVLIQGAPLVARSPYADFMCFQRAANFALATLRSYLEAMFEADLRLKSSGGNPRLVMERLIVGMCLGAGRKAAGAVRGA